MKKDAHLALVQVVQALYDKKAFNILVLDVQNVSTMTDFFIIAEGTSDTHVSALGHTVVDNLRDDGERPVHVEGIRDGDWVVIDYLDVIVHVFKPGMREKYQLEEVWREGKVVDVEVASPGLINQL